MNKTLPALILGSLLVVSPVFAKSPDNEGGEQGNTIHAQVKVQASCDPGTTWSSHGEYISCIAREHLGGAFTSSAARSDIGKHADENNEQESSEGAEPSPSSSSTVSPSPSISPSPTSSVSASPSASASISEGTNIELKAFIAVLQNILKSLQSLKLS